LISLSLSAGGERAKTIAGVGARSRAAAAPRTRQVQRHVEWRGSEPDLKGAAGGTLPTRGAAVADRPQYGLYLAEDGRGPRRLG